MTDTTVRTSDGVALHVQDEGAGPAVVLLAGYGASAATWVFQTEALVEAGYRAVALDRRSHGRSEAPSFGHRMARHGKDLHDALEQLGLRDVVLVGGSMGASTIWAYADLFGTERVRGIVSVDQTPKMLNADGWEHGFYGFTAENAGTFFAGGVPDTGRGLTMQQAMPAFERLMARLGPDAAAMGQAPGTEGLLRDHAQQDWRDVVARTDVPVLMIAGQQSQFWPCEHAEAAVRGTARGRALVVEDCGHAANLDQPDVVNTAILEFVDELRP